MHLIIIMSYRVDSGSAMKQAAAVARWRLASESTPRCRDRDTTHVRCHDHYLTASGEPTVITYVFDVLENERLTKSQHWTCF